MINRLTVVVCPTLSTCCNVQPQKVYNVLADVAFDVTGRVSEALVQQNYHSCVRAPPITTSSLRHILMQTAVTNEEASRRKVVFYHPPAAVAYPLFATDRLWGRYIMRGVGCWESQHD